MLGFAAMLRRELIGGLSAGVTGLLIPDVVWGSYARAVTLSELVHYSQFALVGTPLSASSQWEHVGGARRVVTYTNVNVEQSIDGRPPKTREVIVRTLGGRVGKIGQVVHGEARLLLNRPAVLFLSRLEPALLRVTAMAQGHYPLRADSGGVLRLNESPNLPDLLKPARAAARLLKSKTVPEAERLILDQLIDNER